MATEGPRASSRIPRRQLAVLFAYSLIIWSLGNGLLPLLPVFASTFTTDTLVVGLYLAIGYSAIAIGTLAGGWISDHVGRHRIALILGGATIAPLTMAAGRVSNLAELTLLTASVWFLAGMELTLVSVLAGLFAGPDERGKVFGILTLTGALGALLGGAAVGPLRDALGFGSMFLVLGLAWLAAPVVGAFTLDAPARPPHLRDRPGAASRDRFGKAFYLLIAASTLAGIGLFVGILGRSLSMSALGFSGAAITSTVAVGGLVTLPVPPLLGALSDRRGRTGYLGLCYVASAAGLLVFAGASSLWSFWMASALIAFVSYASTGVGSALVIDLVPPEALGRGMAALNATTWIGAVVGFLGAGYAFRAIGPAGAYLTGAGLTLIAVALLVPIAIQARNSRPVSNDAEPVSGRGGPP